MSQTKPDVFQTQEPIDQAAIHGSMVTYSRQGPPAATRGPARGGATPESVYSNLQADAVPRQGNRVQTQHLASTSPRVEPRTCGDVKSEAGPEQSQPWQPPPMLSPWELCRKAPPASTARYTTDDQGYWPHDSYCTCCYCVDVKSYPSEDYGAQQFESSNVLPSSYQPSFQQGYYNENELQERACELSISEGEGQPGWGYHQGWGWRAPEPVSQDGQPPLHSDDKFGSVKSSSLASPYAQIQHGRVRKAIAKPRKRVVPRSSGHRPSSPGTQMTTPPRSSDTSPVEEDFIIEKSPGAPRNKGPIKRGETVDTTSIESFKRPRFSMEEEYVMLRLREEGMSWAHIASLLPVRGSRSLQVHYSSMLARQFNDWNSEYDMRLVSLVNQHERAMWDVIAERFEEKNIKGISCRYRYLQLHDQQMRSIDKWVTEQRRSRRR